jgi:hypothetical protein
MWTLPAVALAGLTLWLVGGLATASAPPPTCGETPRQTPFVETRSAPSWETFEKRTDVVGVVCPGKKKLPEKKSIEVVIQFGPVNETGPYGGYKWQIPAGMEGEKTHPRTGEGPMIIPENKNGEGHWHYPATSISENGICQGGAVCSVNPNTEYRFRLVAIKRQEPHTEYPGGEFKFKTCPEGTVTYRTDHDGDKAPISCYGERPPK